MSTATHRPHTEQKLSILAECAPSEVFAAVDIEPTEGVTLAQNARRGFAALGIGGLQAETSQLYGLRTPKGTPHFYAQPFDGVLPLPGEHHLVLPFPTPAPATFATGFVLDDWKSPDDGFLRWLAKHPIDRLIQKANFEWKLGLGVVKRRWLVQMRPLGDGTTHLTMPGTGEGGTKMYTRPVGFSTFTKIVLALMGGARYGQPPGPPAPFLEPPRYEAAFEALCRSAGPSPVLPRGHVAGRDLGAAIHGFLAPNATGKLHVHPVPPKRDANARTDVMPREARQLPIVALLDLTMMGSGSDALVLTPSHLFYRSGREKLWFAWSEVRGVDPLDASGNVIRVLLAERGWVALPCGDHAQTMAALMNELARIPAVQSAVAG